MPIPQSRPECDICRIEYATSEVVTESSGVRILMFECDSCVAQSKRVAENQDYGVTVRPLYNGRAVVA